MPMTASTLYTLPFQFLVSEGPVFGGGVSTRVVLRLKGRPDMEEARPVLQAKLMHFGVLCATGALGVLPPEGFDPMTPLFETAEEGDGEIAWTLEDWPADDDSLAVLASLFMGGDAVDLLERVSIAGGGRAATTPLPAGGKGQAYPPPGALPFPHRISHEGQDRFELQLSFDGPPSDEEKGGIEQSLLLWAHAASSGAYGVAPVEPLKCSFQFAEEVDWFDARLSWALTRFRAHPDALDGLLNVCGALHARIRPVVDVLID